MSRLIDVYPYYREHDCIFFLVLKRAANVSYSKRWRMVGGKVNEEETCYEAAIRELKEESGLSPIKFWTIPALNQFYDHNTDTVHNIPAFGAEVNSNKKISLNHEHTDYRWIQENEIENYILWPEQRRLMKLVAKIETNNRLLKEWIIKTR